jgi:hypothetical protein
MQTSIKQYFLTLWLSDADYQAWLVIFQFWPKPVSTVAHMVWIDRTYGYKIMDRLASLGLIQAIIQWWVKHYIACDLSVIRELLNERLDKLKQLDHNFEQVSMQMQQIVRREAQVTPIFQTREWLDGITRIYERMTQQMRSEGILSIHLFSWSTLSAQITAHAPFVQLHHGFCQTCESSKIILESTIADGILLMDHIAHYHDWEIVKNLPIWHSSLIGIVIGHTWYLVMFHDVPRAFSIDHPQVAELMVLLLKRAI